MLWIVFTIMNIQTRLAPQARDIWNSNTSSRFCIWYYYEVFIFYTPHHVKNYFYSTTHYIYQYIPKYSNIFFSVLNSELLKIIIETITDNLPCNCGRSHKIYADGIYVVQYQIGTNQNIIWYNGFRTVRRGSFDKMTFGW